MTERYFYVYILTNNFHNVLYVGVTNNLTRRTCEHQDKRAEGFTRKYNVTKLVYYELHYTVDLAVTREKQIKKWRRDWKDKLITDFNTDWSDLYPTLAHEMPGL